MKNICTTLLLNSRTLLNTVGIDISKYDMPVGAPETNMMVNVMSTGFLMLGIVMIAAALFHFSKQKIK